MDPFLQLLQKRATVQTTKLTKMSQICWLLSVLESLEEYLFSDDLVIEINQKARTSLAE